MKIRSFPFQISCYLSSIETFTSNKQATNRHYHLFNLDYFLHTINYVEYILKGKNMCYFSNISSFFNLIHWKIKNKVFFHSFDELVDRYFLEQTWAEIFLFCQFICVKMLFKNKLFCFASSSSFTSASSIF